MTSRWVLFASICCLGVNPAFAWAPAGHKISVTIAYRLLPAERRAEISVLLRHHPRFAEDFQAKRPEKVSDEDFDEWMVQQASIWPDLARRFQEPLKDQFHRGTWHYCNRPLFLTDVDRRAMQSLLTVNLRTDPPRTPEELLTMNVLQAIERAKTVSMDKRAAKSDRALAMSWLFHLTGDIHQPLHSVSMFSEKLFPSLLDGDRGGNLLRTKQGGQLHGLWDNFPGGDIQYKTACDRAVKFLADHELTSAAQIAMKARSTKAWFDESHELAREYAYNSEVLAYLKQLNPDVPAEDQPKLTLSEDYLKTGGLIARQRVVTAGYRLAELLR